MAARTGMADLIEQVRGMTDAGVEDYTIGTTTYWSDTSLQTTMDRHREIVFNAPLRSQPTYHAGGSVEYRTYYLGWDNVESGTSAFTLEDSTGEDIAGTAYSCDYAAGIVTFNYDTLGSSLYWTGRSYDLNAAAADIWRMKASHSAKYYNFSTDNHNLSRAQLYEHFMQQAQYYERMAQPSSVLLIRTDTQAQDYGDDNDAT